MAKILIVDDETGVRESYRKYLEIQGYETLVAGDFNQAIAELEKCDFDLDVIVTDQVMPGRSGLDLVKTVKERTNRIQLIVMTGEPSVDTASESVRLGIFDYLLKPIQLDRLVSVVLAAVRLKQTEDRAIELESLANERTLALAESEKRYKTLVDTTGEGMAIIRAGVVVFASNRLCEILDVASEDVIGTHFSHFFHQDERHRISELYGRYTGGEGELGIIETRMIHPDGSIVFVEINGARYIYEDEGSVLFSLRDVTERKKSEDDLLRIKVAIDNTSDAIAMATADGTHFYQNKAFSKLFGYTVEEIRDLNPAIIYCDENDVKSVFSRIQAGEFCSKEIDMVSKDGHRFPVAIRANAIKNADGEIVGLVGVHTDITERKQAEEDRLAYMRDLRSLTTQLTIAEGNERRRIASLLHDGIGQNLATIGMKLKLLKETIKGGEAWSEMEAILDIVEKTTEDSRSLTFDLSPPILFQKKIGETLRWLFERECRKMGIRGTFHDGAEDVDVDQPLRILLFHVYRELLFNVGKHSGADELQGSIESGSGSLRISLADNGKGFVYTDARTQDSKATGYGLFSIEERIHYLKGKMTVDSRPSGGTRIEISVPLMME